MLVAAVYQLQVTFSENMLCLPIKNSLAQTLAGFAVSKVLVAIWILEQVMKQWKTWSCQVVSVESKIYHLYTCFALQGAAVLRMLSEFLTEHVFAKGLSVSLLVVSSLNEMFTLYILIRWNSLHRSFPKELPQAVCVWKLCAFRSLGPSSKGLLLQFTLCIVYARTMHLYMHVMFQPGSWPNFRC